MDGGPFLRMEQPITIQGFPAATLAFVFDAAAAETALGAQPQEHVATAAPAAGPESVAVAPSRRPPPRRASRRMESALLVLYETRADGWETAEAIRESTGWPIVIQRLDGSARHRLLTGKTSIVVVDVGEHKERGLTACRRLIRLINGADIPVFICAPAWRREEVQRAIRVGVSGILVKPLDPARIEGAVPAFVDADETSDAVP
jgi:CheY-like chemotaxis protein